MKIVDNFMKDFRENETRYRGLFFIFLFVYFFEVIASRAFNTVSSPERQFWMWWTISSVFLLIPYKIIVKFALLILVMLAAGIIIGVNEVLVGDMSSWLYTVLISAFLSMLVMTWRKK